MKAKLKPSIKAKWLKALRTPLKEGGYRQCTGHLCVTNKKGVDSFCCLGVLTNITEGFSMEDEPNAGNNSKASDDFPTYRLLNNVLTKKSLDDGIHEWSDIEVVYKGESCTLDELNDTKELSFKQIANLIEKQL